MFSNPANFFPTWSQSATKVAPSAARFFQAWPSDCTGVFQIRLRSPAHAKSASQAHGKSATRFARALKYGATKCARWRPALIRFRSDELTADFAEPIKCAE